MIRKPLYVFVLIFLGLAACSSNPPATVNPVDPTLLLSPAAATSPTPIPTQSPDALPTNASGIKLAATVNGQEITYDAYSRALARKQQQVDAATQDTLRADVLNEMIDDALIEQGAKTQNITVTDAQVQAELQSMKSDAGSDDAWKQWLTTNQYTEDDFVESLRLTLLTNAVRDSLTSDLEGNVHQVHARHILVSSLDTANQILTRLKNGEDFATLAKTLSEDETTRENGGDLGWFTQEELLVPELAKAAFSLQPGQIAGPIQTELGYHIVQTLEVADKPIDDPQRRVSIAQTRFDNWLEPLRQSAKIERFIQ